MVRNIVVLGGSSHPQLNEAVCEHLGMAMGEALLSKFAVGETRVEIYESVRGKDVYIIQSGGGKVNDHLMELLITISACKTASAKKVTAVLPLFPYSRQSDIPYNKIGAPLIKTSNAYNKPDFASQPYTFESTPPTPHPHKGESAGLANGIEGLTRSFARTQVDGDGSPQKARTNGISRADTIDSMKTDHKNRHRQSSTASQTNGTTNGTSNGTDDAASVNSSSSNFQARPGYRQWVAQAGTLVADLLICAGADHVITMDLHDPQYQGFFDVPVDNLYGRPLLKKYITRNIPGYRSAVVVSPDAGGAKRATAIADSLGMDFALIHKVSLLTTTCPRTSLTRAFLQERRPTRITDRQNATMMLVGDVANRTAILIDDLADTSNTITRAAKLLKREGAAKVYALVTHGVLSGDAIERINASALDKVVVTNSVPQEEHLKKCPKLEVLDVAHVFAEVCWRCSQ